MASSLLPLIAGFLVGTVVIVGYLALAVVLVLPLLALRRFARSDGNVPTYSGARNLWNAATGRA